LFQTAVALLLVLVAAVVGQDYIVVEDIAGVAETRIPIYSVKSVKVTRLPRK
jgi:hypothetical protein